MDTTKSKVTREGIGLLMYGLYSILKKGGRVALNRFVTDAGLPSPQIVAALKDSKIVENVGGNSAAALWKWLPSSPPNDILIEKVYGHYIKSLQEYNERLKAKSDSRNGVNRAESGQAHAVPSPPGQTSPYVRERLEAIEDRLRYQSDLLETLLQNLGINETLGGRKI